jgi:hypothetical protein
VILVLAQFSFQTGPGFRNGFTFLPMLARSVCDPTAPTYAKPLSAVPQ